MGCMQSADFASQPHQKPQSSSAKAKKTTKKRKQIKAAAAQQRGPQEPAAANIDEGKTNDHHYLNEGITHSSRQGTSEKNAAAAENSTLSPPLDAKGSQHANPFSPPHKAGGGGGGSADRRASSATESSRNGKRNLMVQTVSARGSAMSPLSGTTAAPCGATENGGGGESTLGRSGGPPPAALLDGNQMTARRGLGAAQRSSRVGEGGLNAIKLGSIRTWIDFSDTAELVDPQDVLGHEKKMKRKLAQRVEQQQQALLSIQAPS